MLVLPRRKVIAGLSLVLAGCRAGPARASSEAQAAGRVRHDLYDCEGCEGVYDRNPAELAAIANVGAGSDEGQPLLLKGTVFRTDGRTPAANVVIYAYQTNAAGLYANGSPETEASRRHGRLRGWARTGADGRYAFRTIKPAPYPNENIPAHIHLTVLEPGRRPYWIDDVVFEGEFGVTDRYRASMTNKGGNGIVPLRREVDGRLEVTRDIILEPHP
jgi:protocatechuate 3,4-dioxygenase, beta subunit